MPWDWRLGLDAFDLLARRRAAANRPAASALRHSRPCGAGRATCRLHHSALGTHPPLRDSRAGASGQPPPRPYRATEVEAQRQATPLPAGCRAAGAAQDRPGTIAAGTGPCRSAGAAARPCASASPASAGCAPPSVGLILAEQPQHLLAVVVGQPRASRSRSTGGRDRCTTRATAGLVLELGQLGLKRSGLISLRCCRCPRSSRTPGPARGRLSPTPARPGMLVGRVPLERLKSII